MNNNNIRKNTNLNAYTYVIYTDVLLIRNKEENLNIFFL
jgi:hypothetical protein